MLERFEHRLRLRELHFGLLEAAGQYIEVERQIAEPIGEVLVLADVE
jgi:hypothetical protein